MSANCNKIVLLYALAPHMVYADVGAQRGQRTGCIRTLKRLHR